MIRKPSNSQAATDSEQYTKADADTARFVETLEWMQFAILNKFHRCPASLRDEIWRHLDGLHGKVDEMNSYVLDNLEIPTIEEIEGR